MTIPRLLRIVTVLAALAIVVTLLAIPYLPFQDVPQQVRMLSQQRTLHARDAIEFYRVRTSWVFGYSLYRWLDFAAAPLMSTTSTLRLMFMVSFVAFPLAMARLASRLGASPWLVALLGIPLAMSSQFRLGLAPFVLGFPCMLCALVAAVDFIERRQRWKPVELAFWLGLAYVSHPLTFGFAAILVALAWLIRGFGTPYATAGFLAAAVPSVLMAAHDLANDAFSNIEGIEIGWPVPKVVPEQLRDIWSDFFLESWGINNATAMVCALPVLVVTIVCIVQGARSSGESTRDWKRALLLIAALLFALFTILGPRTIGTTFKVSPRFALVSVVCLVTVAGRALPKLRPGFQLAVMGAVIIGASFTAFETVSQASEIRAIVGDRPPRSLDGRVAPIRFHDCRAEGADSRTWDVYDPLWHIWAYGLTDRGVAAQAFAFSRYHIVQFRNDVYPKVVAAPDWEALSHFFPHDRCHENNLLRLAWVLGTHNADTVLAIQMPDRLRAALARTRYRIQAIGPQFIAITEPPAMAEHVP